MTSTRDSAELVNNLKDSAFDFNIYSSVASAKADTKLKVGDTVQTTGYYSENDGGGANYIVVAGGTGIDDGGFYHDMSNGNQLSLNDKEIYNIKVFGAVGDGVSDNSSAFLSAGNISAIIPTGNFIVENGGALRGRYTGDGSINGIPVAEYLEFADLSKQKTQYKLASLDVSSLGVSPERFAQGVAFNSNANKVYLYLRTAGSTDKNDERLRFVEFDLTTEGATLTPTSSTVDLQTGHQGISIEYRDPDDPTNIYLWTKGSPTQADTPSNEQTGKSCQRWDYQGASTSSAQRLVLFPDNGTGDPLDNYYNITPAISSDQKYLLVKVSSFGTPTSDQRIFIYDLEFINTLSAAQWLDPSNFDRNSEAYITDWPLSREQLRTGNFTQGLACDGDFVYVFCGGNELTPENKDNIVYTMNGKLVGRFDHTLGNPALNTNPPSGTLTAWEPEGGDLSFQGDRQAITLINASWDDAGTNRVTHELWGLRKDSASDVARNFEGVAELGSDLHFKGGIPYDISFNDGDNLDFQVITDLATGAGYIAFRLQSDGAIELYQPDDTSGSRVRRGVGVDREILELRGNTGITDGASINVYGGTDSTFPNQVFIYTQNDNSTPDVIVDDSGRLLLNSRGLVKLTNATGSSNIDRSESVNREILQIRANESLAEGAGINMYGNADSTNPGSIINTLGVGGNFEIDNLPTSNPGGSGRLWNNGGVLNIT